MKRPAYEPATNPPPQKRPPVEEEDAISILLDEEEDLGISISLTDEERLNLVSPLLTSKVTVPICPAWTRDMHVLATTKLPPHIKKKC